MEQNNKVITMIILQDSIVHYSNISMMLLIFSYTYHRAANTATRGKAVADII